MNQPSLLTKNLVLACLSSFLYFGSFYLLLPILPQYVESLGGTTSQIGLVMGIFTLISVVIRPNFGKLVDKYGRKRFLIFGAGLFSLLFALYGQVHTIIPLYVLRAAHGIAHGSFLAASYAYIADLAPPSRRGEVMGIYGVSNVVAMALFPAMGSTFITHNGSFSTLFILSLAVAGCAFLSVCFLDEVMLKGGPSKKPSIMAAVRQRSVLIASLTLFSASTIYGAVVTFLPVYAPGKGLENVGIFFSTYAIFTLISRLIAGKLSDRVGRRSIILPSLLIVAAAVFMLPLLGHIYLLMLIGACFGLGFGAFMPALNAFVVDETTLSQRASALAFFTSFMDVGITTGALVLGFVGQFWGYETMFGLGGVIVILGVLLFAACGKTTPSSDVHQEGP
jgi:MFS family permease